MSITRFCFQILLGEEEKSRRILSWKGSGNNNNSFDVLGNQTKKFDVEMGASQTVSKKAENFIVLNDIDAVTAHLPNDQILCSSAQRAVCTEKYMTN